MSCHAHDRWEPITASHQQPSDLFKGLLVELYVFVESLWQFWIDVGGTFTDCLGVSPDGQEHLTKVLSSGATKGTIQQWLSPSSFTLPHRNGDGEDFWSGAAIRFFDSSGTQIAENVVEVYDDSSGEFYCESVLPDALRETSVTVELDLQLHAPIMACLLYTSPSPRDRQKSRMPSSA